MDKNNKFPLEVFPDTIQAIIHHKYELENWNKEPFAINLISSVASTIGNNVKFNNGKWIVKPLFWFAIIGNQGTKKSHIQKFAFKYLLEKDRVASENYKVALSEQVDKNEEIPKAKTTVLTVYTPESIIGKHEENRNGLVLFQDELAGWIKGFNQYSSGGEKEQMLSFFNGDDYKVNRVGKEYFVPDTCLNLIGGIQPSKLEILNNKESQGDGFLTRMLFVENKVERANVWSEEIINNDLLNEFDLLFREIDSYPETMLTLSKDAKTTWIRWYNESNEQALNNEFERALQAKIETYLGRMVIVIEILNQCSIGGVRSEQVSVKSLEGAIQIIEFHRNIARGLFKESFHPLASNPEELAVYKTLEFDKVYSTKEIVEAFNGVIEKTTVKNRKLTKEELFTKVKHGMYKKTYNDEK